MTILEKLYKYLWCVDRTSIGILLLLISISSFELIHSLRIVELRMSRNIFLFKKHLFFVIIFFIGIVILSNLSYKDNILLCHLVGLFALLLCILVIIFGYKINGSRRWIRVLYFTLQPSVFLKNTLGIFFPFLFKNINNKIFFICFCCVIVLFQPDFGMCLLLLTIALVELFLMYDKNLLQYRYMFLTSISIFITFLFFKGNYLLLRINKFLSPQGLYQSNIALQNIKNTSFFGNYNTVNIPDAHCDFIIASIMSHYGIFTGVLIIFLFILFFVHNIQQANIFLDKRKIVVYGILTQITFQSIFHLASNLNFIPPKGVSCPFLSFGGSELLASIFSIGTLLSITKKN
jgi:cell division protein FtsW